MCFLTGSFICSFYFCFELADINCGLFVFGGESLLSKLPFVFIIVILARSRYELLLDFFFSFHYVNGLKCDRIDRAWHKI